MEGILIADAGSTKTTWALNSNVVATTKGINALVTAPKEMDNTIRNLKKALKGSEIKKIFFYGAGCIGGEANERIIGCLNENFELNKDEIEVESDMLGAARALFGHERGIACILGTGSNTCFYDGKEIVKNVPAMGFILGDEGSGAVLGKRLIQDIYKGNISLKIKKKFEDEYHLSLSEIITKVYRESSPNRFLASFVPFLKRNLDHTDICRLVKDEFNRFFEFNVSHYYEEGSHELGFVGSIAYHFSEVLKEVAEIRGFTIKSILQEPIEGLINYHSSK